MQPIAFAPQPTNWQTLISSEILGPFASRTGWIWSREHKDPRTAKPSKAVTSQTGVNIIKSILGKALVTRFMRKSVSKTLEAEPTNGATANPRPGDNERKLIIAQRVIDFEKQKVGMKVLRSVGGT